LRHLAVKIAYRAVKQRLKQADSLLLFLEQEFENEAVNFYLPKIFKNKKQLWAFNLRQKAAFGREMTYFWRWKEDIEILRYFLDDSCLYNSTIQ